MSSEENEKAKQSEPREIRVNRLNRNPGPNKAIISLGLLLILIVVFIFVFLRYGF